MLAGCLATGMGVEAQVPPWLHLRVWSDDGVHGFERLEPDQRLALVGYASVPGPGWIAGSAVGAWTGSELIVFGGRANGGPVAALQRLNPQPDWYSYRKP